jgi:hypothetical protein
VGTGPTRLARACKITVPGQTPAILCATSQFASQEGAIPLLKWYWNTYGAEFFGEHVDGRDQIPQRRPDGSGCLSGKNGCAVQPDRTVPEAQQQTGSPAHFRRGGAAVDQGIRRILRRRQRRLLILCTIRLKPAAYAGLASGPCASAVSVISRSRYLGRASRCERPC